MTSLEMIRARAELLRQLRAFFDSRGFLEVQPPCLSRDCVVDAYIDPIAIPSASLQLPLDLPEQFFLQTSPEAAMKRMLADGAPSIYSMGPVFRSGERGPLHNPEFTLLEWYELDANTDDGIRTLGSLAAEILGCDGFDVADYRSLFAQYLGLDPIDAPIDWLRDLVIDVDSTLAKSIGEHRDSLLEVLFAHRIESHLGPNRPIVVKNYPLGQAALAKAAEEDPQCAARFELFYKSVELANGYNELQDPDILIQRMEANNERRLQTGRSPIKVDSPLVEAMRKGLPQSAGVALGVDRLLMLHTGARSIDEVTVFPIELA